MIFFFFTHILYDIKIKFIYTHNTCIRVCVCMNHVRTERSMKKKTFRVKVIALRKYFWVRNARSQSRP